MSIHVCWKLLLHGARTHGHISAESSSETLRHTQVSGTETRPVNPAQNTDHELIYPIVTIIVCLYVGKSSGVTTWYHWRHVVAICFLSLLSVWSFLSFWSRSLCHLWFKTNLNRLNPPPSTKWNLQKGRGNNLQNHRWHKDRDQNDKKLQTDSRDKKQIATTCLQWYHVVTPELLPTYKHTMMVTIVRMTRAWTHRHRLHQDLGATNLCVAKGFAWTFRTDVAMCPCIMYGLSVWRVSSGSSWCRRCQYVHGRVILTIVTIIVCLYVGKSSGVTTWYH
jgi:hypothetical protein